MEILLARAAAVAGLLRARRQTVAVAESSTGGLISAALLSVPGASAYFLGGGVIYTRRARHRLLDLTREDVQGLKSASEPYAVVLAQTVRRRFKADWGISETGASGPLGNPYGDAAGHCCFAVAGAGVVSRTLETGVADRVGNMLAFSVAVLGLLEEAILAG